MGFDNECILNIQNLAGEYFCPVCRMLVYPNEALQSQCTHLYCKPCLTYIVATTRACPYDGYLVTLEDSKPLHESNKTLAETIGKIAVHCLYRRSGCTWQGPLSDCPSHWSACAFGNSPVVCNRCAIQILHRQVQEHAQTCPGVPSQGQTGEGTQSSAVATSTNHTQANVQSAITSSQAHASHLTTASIPGQVLDQPVNQNLNFPLYAQAALPISDLSHQQQHYQQYAGYDPYQQHYQQHPHLPHQPQVQSLPQPQQRPPSVVHTQPPAQQYPQSQAISVNHQQNQSYPIINPQSHSHLQNHSLAQALPNQPQLHPHAPQHSQLHPQQLHVSQYQQNHPQAQAQLQPHPQPHSTLQAQPSVPLQQNSHVHPHAYHMQANFMNHYPSISNTQSYHLQSQSGTPQHPSGYPYPQEDHYQQQQRALRVQNQVSLPLMNPTELQAINQQNHSVMTSSSQHQIVPTVQQPNFSHHEDFHMLHHRPTVQASGQALAPQQQVPVTTHAPEHSQLHSNHPPPMSRQNVTFPRNEPAHQSQNQIGRTCEQLQTFPVTTEGVVSSGLQKQPGTQNGFQSEPNNVSAENIAAKGRLEGKETSLVGDKPIEALPARSASGNKVPSDENGVKEERLYDSEKRNSVGRSGSVLSDLKEGDPDKIKSKRLDSQNVQPANEIDEVAGSFPLALDSDRQLMVNASPYVFEGNSTMPSSLISHPRNSFDERQPHIHHSGSFNEANLTPAGLKAGPDIVHAFGWRDDGFRAPKDKILLEQGSVRFLREDILQIPRPPNVESEFIHKHGGFFSSMSYERDSFGERMIPRPLDKALYGLHHDKHLQPGAISGDNRLDISRDFQNAASIYGRHFGVPQTISDREHPNVSAHAIRYGSRADFRLGIDRRDHCMLAAVKPLNLLSDTADLSFVSSASSNLHPHLHRGSFSGQTHKAELSRHGSISSLGEVGYRNNLLLTDNQIHEGDLELYANIRKRKAATTGWCRICKVDCDTVEGLDLHSQTREHQRMSIDMVLKIKQQNSKWQSMISSEFDPLHRKHSSRHYRI